MAISMLYTDILRIIISLSVNPCRQTSDFQGDDDHPYLNTSASEEALITLIRLSHINSEWRSLALLCCTLWARHLHITPHMSAGLLEDIVNRTGEQPIHLRVFDVPPQHPIWPQATRLFRRCIALYCQMKRYPQLMATLTTTPAPVLQHCAIFCEAPSQGTWGPLFAGFAPALRHLRLTRTWNNGLGGSRLLHISAITSPGMLALGGLQHLTHLELNFPTDAFQYIPSPSPFADLASTTRLSHVKELKLTGNPFTIAYLLQAVALPALDTISAVYIFSADPIIEAVSVIWEPLLRHFPSFDFPTFKIHCGEENYRFHILHANGQGLKLQFHDQGLSPGIDVDTRLLLPLIHVPPTHVSPSQILHGVAWMRLVSVPGFVDSVKTVVVSSRSPNSSFPYHAHFLLSAMVAAHTLRFDDCASALHPVWYDLLRDTTGMFGHSPLPNISTISLPTDSLERTLSNVGLRDLLWDRHEGSALSRLHFAFSSSEMENVRGSLSILKEISKTLSIMVSFEPN